MVKKSVRFTVQDTLDHLKSVEEGHAAREAMNYKQLVEEINKDLKALEGMDKPLTVYKEEKELAA